MGRIKMSLDDVDDALEELTKRAMRVRELGRAADTLGLEKLGEDLIEVGEDVVAQVKEIESAVSTIVRELGDQIEVLHARLGEGEDDKAEEAGAAEPAAEPVAEPVAAGKPFGA